MDAKRVGDSKITLAMQMQPHHANPAGNVHGGVIMSNIDTSAGVAALRHCAMNAVTASIDRLDFHHPVYVGDVLHLTASLNMVGSSSMEVGVRVTAENPRSGKMRHTASAYLTFVALDDDGQPAEVPELILETPGQLRRNQEAILRRDQRLAERQRERSSLDD